MFRMLRSTLILCSVIISPSAFAEGFLFEHSHRDVGLDYEVLLQAVEGNSDDFTCQNLDLGGSETKAGCEKDPERASKQCERNKVCKPIGDAFAGADENGCFPPIVYECDDIQAKRAAMEAILSKFGISVGDICKKKDGKACGTGKSCLPKTLWQPVVYNPDGIDVTFLNRGDGTCSYQLCKLDNGEDEACFWGQGCDCDKNFTPTLNEVPQLELDY